jgi:hypothetical protein
VAPKVLQPGPNLLRGAEVGLRHDLDEGDTGTIQIDMARPRGKVMPGLAGILLQMNPADPNGAYPVPDLKIEGPGPYEDPA